MTENQGDTIRLSCGETLKFGDGHYKKYEAEYTTKQKPGESMKDCFIRAKKLVDAMATVMRPK